MSMQLCRLADGLAARIPWQLICMLACPWWVQPAGSPGGSTCSAAGAPSQPPACLAFAPPQWPLERLSAFRTHQLVEELAIAQQQYSTEYEDEVHTERDGSEAQVGAEGSTRHGWWAERRGVARPRGQGRG